MLPSLDVPSRVLTRDPAVAAWLEAARSGVIARLEASHEPSLLSSEDRSGWTALHWAAAKDHEQALAWLLNKGASVHASGGSSTALIIAAHLGHSECVAELLAHGAAPNACDKKGLSAWHHAAASGSVNTVVALIGSGASLAVAQAKENRDRSTPIGIASRSAATASGAQRSARCLAVLRQLEKESRLLQAWFRAARATADVEALREKLTSMGTDAGRARLANVYDANGKTALTLCARSGSNAAAVRLLIEHGADPNQADGNGLGLTALHELAMNPGSLDMLETLLRAGANPLLRATRDRETPFELLKSIHPRGEDIFMDPPEDASPGLVEILTRTTAIACRLRRADRHARLMRRWRVLGRTVGTVLAWQARAAERAYAPGAPGFVEAEADFEQRVAKVQRTEEHRCRGVLGAEK